MVMSNFDDKVLVSNSIMTGIADAIRLKNETSNPIATPDMPGLIAAIETYPPLQEKNVEIDGSDESVTDIVPDEGYYGLNKVTISVVNCGPSVDGGFTVNFYDADSKLMQTTSSACGVFVGPPASYKCDGWKDTDDETVELPITFDEADSMIDLYPIFLGYQEYSVAFADYPIKGVELAATKWSDIHGADFKLAGATDIYGTAHDNDFYQLYIREDSGNGDNTARYACVIEGLQTKKCNRVRVKYSNRYGNWIESGSDSGGGVYMYINNDESTKQNVKMNIADQYITFDVTGETLSLHAHVSDGSDGVATNVIIIHEIYFYYENEE